MKSKLNELVLSELIELACGNYYVLLENKVSISDKYALAEIARNILTDYSFIADNAHAKSMIYEKENEMKGNVRIMQLEICSTLVDNGGKDQAAAILNQMGESVDEDISAQIDMLLKYALFEKERNRSTNDSHVHRTPEEIRSSFYSEIAFMMTYFKMNIKASEINAEVYANIVRQADLEIRNRNIRT